MGAELELGSDDTSTPALARTSRRRVAAAWGALLSCVVLGCTHDFDAFSPVPAADGGGGDSPGADAFGKCEAPARSYAGHCYFPLSGAGVGWDDARKACEAASAHLATLTSSEEEAIVESILPGVDRWIGLRRPVGSPAVDASFAWITGEPSTYKTWAVGEPNGSGECVGILGAGHWGDQDCNTKLAAVCERQ